jgi:hypothetical protein
MWACQRSRVLGDTSRSRRSGVGSNLLSALRNARSSQLNFGRGLPRRSTATSWRSTRISTSLAVSDRASSASQLSTWVSSSLVGLKAPAGDHAAQAADHDRESAFSESADQMTRFSAPAGRHPFRTSWELASLPRAPARVRAGSTSRSGWRRRYSCSSSADRLVCSRRASGAPCRNVS